LSVPTSWPGRSSGVSPRVVAGKESNGTRGERRVLDPLVPAVELDERRLGSVAVLHELPILEVGGARPGQFLPKLLDGQVGLRLRLRGDRRRSGLEFELLLVPPADGVALEVELLVDLLRFAVRPDEDRLRLK